MKSGYALRPDAGLPAVYLYRDAVDFRNYVLNLVMRRCSYQTIVRDRQPSF